MIRRILSIGLGGRPHSKPSSGSLPFFRHQRGFSVVEMIVSVLLLAIGAALALPSYRDMVEKRQVTNGAEQVAAFVNSAQGAAMKTNRIIKVSWVHNDEDDWCVGATVVPTLDASACDCTGTSELAPACTINGQDFVVNQSHADDRELMQDIGSADTGSYSFDPIRGFSPDLADDLVFRMRSDSGDFRLNLMVNRTGRVILCSPSESHAVPGYQPCPIVPEEPSA